MGNCEKENKNVICNTYVLYIMEKEMKENT